MALAAAQFIQPMPQPLQPPGTIGVPPVLTGRLRVRCVLS